jgi:HKD family nuclease
MQSRLLAGTAELAKVFREWSDKAETIRVVTAWATMDCAVCDSLKKSRNKITTMVIGLDFFSTSPSFLEDFWSIIRIGDAVRGGTFHPKLYLFENAGQCCCITGSSNFTSGGFGRNTELNICIEGSTSDPFFHQTSKFIDDQEKHSELIGSVIFDDYKARYNEYRSVRQKLSKFKLSKDTRAKAKEKQSREAAGQEPPEQLNRSWREFVDLVLAPQRKKRVTDDAPSERGYLNTSEHCQELFAKHGRLSKMSLRDRQFVGGTTREGGWFGSMRGNGDFKQRLNDDPASLDTALDHIPLTGLVSKRQYDSFAARYERERARVATGSRLLAMKRPDLFICIDSRNRSGIAKAFGVPASSLDNFEGYWNLMVRIWRCPWWLAPRPKGVLDGRIWDARVALLDSLYYVDSK